MASELTEHQCDTGTVVINYAEGPANGPPLVFLHGGSARWRAYEDVLPQLAQRFHLFAPDFRGHGLSGRVPGSYTLQAFVDDTVVFLREVVAEPAHLFGHSMGGDVALMVAAQHGECVRSVVVGDSPLPRQKPRTEPDAVWRARNAAMRELAGGRLSVEEIAEVLKDAPTDMPGRDGPVTMREKWGEDAEFFTWSATNLYYNDPDMLAATLEAGFQEGYEVDSLLNAIRCPILLLQGDPAAGGMITDDQVDLAKSLSPLVSHVRLEGIGHFIFAPDEGPVLEAVFEFLKDR
jgi:pimeloyl-ACP methyl ester carboxylesterase